MRILLNVQYIPYITHGKDYIIRFLLSNLNTFEIKYVSSIVDTNNTGNQHYTTKTNDKL